MGHTWLRKHNPDINWVTGDVKMSRCSGRCCSGCRDEIREERREQKVQARRIADCPKEIFLTLTEMMKMTKTWMRKLKMATEYSPPVYINLQRRSVRPPPSLNTWQKPSNGTETLLIPKRTPPFQQKTSQPTLENSVPCSPKNPLTSCQTPSLGIMP